MKLYIFYYDENGKYLSEEPYIFSRYYGIGEIFMRNCNIYRIIDSIIIDKQQHVKVERQIPNPVYKNNHFLQ